MSFLKNFDNYQTMVSLNRNQLQRIFFLIVFGSLCLNYSFHLLIHQIGNNPLKDNEVDVVYWFFNFIHLPQLILKFGVLFDSILAVSCILSFIWNNQTITCRVFFIAHFIYFVLYNMLAGHHYTNVGLLFMSFPFIFSSATRFSFCFALCRFAFCFILLSAACWKIARGNLAYPDQLYQLVLDAAISSWHSKHSLHAEIIIFLVQHKYWCHIIWVALITLEFSFILGFFSFKYDFILLINYLLFFIGGWLVLSLFNLENLFFLLTLFPVLELIDKVPHFR